jgi:ABC-type Zn uptake system ZnuABC Zn-binding protein ZnuA
MFAQELSSMRRVISIIVLIIMMNGIPAHAQADVLQVLASTSLIADVAQVVGGEQVEVSTLIPPGTDVHSFNLSPRDVVKIAEADLVLVNGMRLEGNLLDVIITNAAVDPIVVSIGVPVLPIGAHTDHEHADAPETLGILGEDVDCDDPLISLNGTVESDEDTEAEAHLHGPCDPHVWMDVTNVMTWTNNIAAAFAAVDPEHADSYTQNAADYISMLEDLDTQLRGRIKELPVEARLLVTNHDFLGYFAAAYDFSVIGMVSPAGGVAAEVSPRSLAQLVDTIESTGVPIIFAEFSDGTRLADAVAAEADIQVVEIYSDSLSDRDGPAATYVAFMTYNVNSMLSALTPEDDIP